jgi:hypothetical protein
MKRYLEPTEFTAACVGGSYTSVVVLADDNHPLQVIQRAIFCRFNVGIGQLRRDGGVL